MARSHDDDQRIMSFGEHLEELRLRVLLALGGLIVALLVCYFGFRIQLYEMMWWPMQRALVRAQAEYAPTTHTTTQPTEIKPVFTSPSDAFMVLLKTSFVAAFVIASPWVFYQMWAFIRSGLHANERRYVYILLPFSLLLFLAGAAFCYFLMMPFGLQFLVAEGMRMGASPLMEVNEYLSFSLSLIVIFGAAFQLPLIMMFLAKAGIVQVKTYRRYRKHAILILVIVAAIVTPTTDMVSEILLAGPLVALYELGILLSRVRLGRKPAPADEADRPATESLAEREPPEREP